MKYEEAREKAIKNFCPKFQDLRNECQACPICKECWAGYHVDANRMTAADFDAFLEKANKEYAAAVSAVFPTR